MTKEEIEAAQPGYKKVIQPHIYKCVQRYNKWVKQKRRMLTTFRPREWRTDLKRPFKFSSSFLATKESQLTDYPELAAMEADAQAGGILD